MRAVALTCAVVMAGTGTAAADRKLAFTDGGARLVASQQGELAEIDAATGRELARIKLDSAEAPNPHGRSEHEKLSRVVGDSLWAWDAKAGELIGVVLVGTWWGQAYSGAAVWRPASGGEPLPLLAAVGVNCQALAISADRTRAALRVNARQGGDCDGANAVQVFDLTTQQPISKPIEVGRALTAAFSADGQQLAIGSDRARLYDVRSATLQTAPASNVVDQIVIHPTTSRLIWHTSNDELESWLPGEPRNADHGTGQDLALSPDGKRVAVVRRKGIDLLDASSFAASGERIAFDGQIDALAFSDDGSRLAAASSHAVTVWRVGTPAAAAAPSTWFARLRPLPVPPPRPMPPFTRVGVVEGRVLLDGRPLAGAEIELRPDPHEYPDARKLKPIKARSGAGGTFRITRVPTIDWHLHVRARGALDGSGDGQLRDVHHKRSDVNLQPAATVVGKVLGPDRRPARGVRVFHADDHSTSEREVISKADGSFAFDELYPKPNGFRFVAIRADGAVRTTEVDISKPGVVRATVVLAAPDDPLVVRGTIVDESGAPVVGVDVIVNESAKVKTDARGRFAVDLPVSPGGAFRLRTYGGAVGVETRVTLPLAAPLQLVAKPH